MAKIKKKLRIFMSGDVRKKFLFSRSCEIPHTCVWEMKDKSEEGERERER